MTLAVDTRVSGSTVESEVTVPRELRRFFTGEPFRAEYDVDLTGLHPGLASVPALAYVCPVAWANGVDVRARTADETFLAALREVRAALVRMYPEFMQGGSVGAETVVDVATERPADRYGDSALLFTGGIDSIASFVRHHEGDPTLVCVQGWVVDIDEEERWRETRRHVEAFADAHGVDDQYVRSNFRSALETPMLLAHYKRYLDGGWFSAVGHGLGLTGLCAPLSDALGLDTVHIAATHTAEFDQPWGSDPDIDNRVRWAHTRANHDGYELSRQDKVERIAEYVDGRDAAFAVRTCTQSATGANCNRCEKCYRTICGMVLAGIDPNRFGYEADADTFREIRRGFETGQFLFEDHVQFYWEDIQRHVDTDRAFPVEGATAFFEWFEDLDLAAFAAESERPLTDRLARAVARNVPYPVYSTAYTAYTSLKD